MGAHRNEINPPKAEASPAPFSPFGFGDSGSSGSSDFKAIAIDALGTLRTKVLTAIPKAGDAITRIHLQEAVREMNDLLNEKK